MSELDINLKALKKVDPYVRSIEGHSSNVALYNFNSDRAEWEKTQIEGTLFLFQREAEPKYGFTIMNRLNPENHIEPVTGQLDFQIQPPFLLYKNSNNEIRGIWFYSRTECENVGQKIQRLVREVEMEKEQRSKRGVRSSPGCDLAALLEAAERSKAQSDETVSSTTDTGKNLLRLLSHPENGISNTSQLTQLKPSKKQQKPEVTTSSVKDFFAMASSSQLRATPTGEPVGNGGPQFIGQENQHGLQGAIATGVTHTQPGFGMPPVIQALPIAQGLAMGAVPVVGFAQYAGNGSAVNMLPVPSPVGALTVDKVESIQDNSRSSLSPETSGNPLKQGSSLGDLESRLKHQLMIHQGGQAGPRDEPEGLSGPPHSATHQEHIPLKQAAHTNLPVKQAPQQAPPPLVHPALRRESLPKLLSPQVFSEPADQSPSLQMPLPSQGANQGPHLFPGEGIDSRPHITPLTRHQIVEALEFLLAEDEEFADKLHQAYIRALSNKFKIVQ